MIKYRKQCKCHYLSVKNDPYDYTDWAVFYWGWHFDISYELCGYFDNRPRINLDLIFFSLCIILPFRNKWTDECDPPKWGVAIHNNTLWIYRGGKGNGNGGTDWWTWNIPFVTMKLVRSSILLSPKGESMRKVVSLSPNLGRWEHEYPGNSKDFWEDEWKSKQMSWEYDFTDKYDGEVIPTTIFLEEREWRPKWLAWTSRFAKVRTTIDVHFSKQVGSGKGGWKGGTLGCGYELNPREHPLDCLKRMENEREF